MNKVLVTSGDGDGDNKYSDEGDKTKITIVMGDT